MGIDVRSHCGTVLDYIKSRAVLPTWLTRREKNCNRQESYGVPVDETQIMKKRKERQPGIMGSIFTESFCLQK